VIAVGAPDLILLIVCVLVAIYLFFALIRPEQF
jgi:K+-transporting ATPase KdpF subunit